LEEGNHTNKSDEKKWKMSGLGDDAIRSYYQVGVEKVAAVGFEETTT